MEFKETIIKQPDPVVVYSSEVRDLMRSDEGRGMTTIEAMRIVLADHDITDFDEVGIWMSRIGKYRKDNADWRRWKKQSVEVPIGKHLEQIKKKKEPYEDPFVRADRIQQDREINSAPLFEKEIKEARAKEKELRGF
ncbi:MAG: hypothetical protein NTZ49_05595 [Candidatus Parcubacteria bacterium]|nr:hypothetical protein [Candidatus Parcubacteria bacterium]